MLSLIVGREHFGEMENVMKNEKSNVGPLIRKIGMGVGISAVISATLVMTKIINPGLALYVFLICFAAVASVYLMARRTWHS